MKSITTFRSLLYRGILATILGIMVFIGFTMTTLIILIGVAIALAGLTAFWFRYRNPHAKSSINFLQLALSVVNVIFGIILIIMPNSFEKVFLIILGVVIIVAGIVQLFDSLCVSGLTRNAKIFLGISVLLIILGSIFLIISIYEVTEIENHTLFFGIIVSIYGVSNIIMSFWYRSCAASASKSIEKPAGQIEDVAYESVDSEKEVSNDDNSDENDETDTENDEDQDDDVKKNDDDK